MGRLHPHARRAVVPDRQPLLRLEVRVRARAAHGRPPHLPRARQGARRIELDQRDDLPARQPAGLRALGAPTPAWRTGTTPTACRTSSAWRRASPAPTTGAAATARSCSSGARPTARSSAPSSRPCSRPATRSPRTSTATARRASAPFDRNIYRGRRMSAARAYLHPVLDRPNLEVRTPRVRHPRALRGNARRRRRGRAPGPDRADRGRRGHPLRRRDQLAAAAAALRASATPTSSRRSASRRARAAGGRREPAGPPRGLRPVRLQAAGLGRAGDEVPQPAVGRPPVAVLPPRPGRDQPLRGRRLRALQRGRRLPEPDVPLPAIAIRYDGSAPQGHGYQVHVGPMYSDARGSVQDRLDRPASSIRRCASTTSRPNRIAASGSRRSTSRARS